jgi:hypothetical protein
MLMVLLSLGWGALAWQSLMARCSCSEAAAGTVSPAAAGFNDAG